MIWPSSSIPIQAGRGQKCYKETMAVSCFGTPWKINMEPENDGLEDDFPFQLGDF